MISKNSFDRHLSVTLALLMLQSPLAYAQAPTSQKPLADQNSKMKFADAGIEDITNKNFPDLIESFDYPNAEITDVIRAISKLTGKNFIVDPQVRGKITIMAPSQISVAEAWKAFLSALAINGYTVVPSGQFLKIKPARDAQRDSIETYSGAYFPSSDQFITRIVKLKYISADEVNRNLRALSSKYGEMQPYPATNSVIISDYGSNIERIMSILNELDQPGFEERLEVIPIRHAKAKNLADLISQIINKDDGKGGGAGGFSPANRFRSSTLQTGGSGKGNVNESLSMVAPDERTNAIIVVGNDAGVQKIKDLVKKLDYAIDPAENGGVFVYYVKHGEAKTISQTLSGIAQESEKARQETEGAAGGTGTANRFVPPAVQKANNAIFGGDVKITADENTNSLIITASKQDYNVVVSLLEKLDIAKDQVFVEAYIVEMRNNGENRFNISAMTFDKSSNGLGRAGFVTGSLSEIVNPSQDKGAILSFGQGDTVDVNIGSAVVKVPNLLAFMKLLTTHTDSNILSTPQVIALDNEDAEIEVGREVPYATTTMNNIGVQGGVQFKKVSIKLKIKPYISPDTDVVRLNVDQQVQDFDLRQILGNDAPEVNQKSVKTNIVLSSGDTAVLGGLVQDNETITETKVPFLGDIPILGWLFKGRTQTKTKSNLLIFLTPKIIRNPIDQKQLLTKKLDQRVDFIRRHGTGRDPHGKLFSEIRSSRPEKDQAGAIEPQEEGFVRSNRNNGAPSLENSNEELDLENAPLDQEIQFE